MSPDPGQGLGSDVAASPEDAKLLVLARAARARTGAAQGAAVRDDMGRTYAASSVDLPSLRLSAVQAAVAAAVSSGSESLEAVAVVGGTDGSADPAGLAELAGLAEPDRLLLADLAVTTVLRG